MWTYNRALQSGAFTGVYVATDDPRIKKAVEEHRGMVIMTSADHTSGTDRIYEASQHIDFDCAVNLQGDEPLIPVDILRDFADNALKMDKMSLLTCVSYATIEDVDSPNVVKVVLATNGDALYFSRSPIPYNRDGAPHRYYKHCGIYGFTKESLKAFCTLKNGSLEEREKLEQLRALEHGMRVHCLVRDFKSIGIDTREDLEAFKRHVAQTAHTEQVVSAGTE